MNDIFIVKTHELAESSLASKKSIFSYITLVGLSEVGLREGESEVGAMEGMTLGLLEGVVVGMTLGVVEGSTVGL